MILLLSPYLNAPECAAQIQRVTHETVKTVSTIPLALAALRKEEYAIVIADENLLESSPGSSQSLVQQMATAIPLFLDLACLRPEKLQKVVRQTCQRREMEYHSARKYAVTELRNELRNDVTGLLLSSEIIAKDHALPAPLAKKLALVLEIANRLKSTLEM